MRRLEEIEESIHSLNIIIDFKLLLVGGDRTLFVWNLQKIFEAPKLI
jgi:hypothetical protein